MSIQKNTHGDADSEQSQLSLFDAFEELLQNEPLPAAHAAEVVESTAPTTTKGMRGVAYEEEESFEDAVIATKATLNDYTGASSSRSPPKLARDFEKLFQTLTYSRDRWNAFSDFAEIGAVWIATSLYDHAALFGVKMFDRDPLYESLVERGNAVIKRYNEKEIKTFADMCAIVGEGAGLGGCDFLGELYQSLEIKGNKSRQASGEFLTPYSLAKMMARMQLDDAVIRAAIKEKGFISMEEPACGAGCLMIAAAECLAEMGYDPKHHMFIVIRDVSRLCFNMAYMQMASLGIPGIVIHGNTLTLETWEDRPTPQLIFRVKEETGQIAKEYIQHVRAKEMWTRMGELLGDARFEQESARVERQQQRQEKKNASGYAGAGFGKKERSEEKPAKRKKKDMSGHTQLNVFDVTLDSTMEL